MSTGTSLWVSWISVASTFVSQLKKLRRKINEDTNQFQTLFSLVNDEIQSQSTKTKNSTTDALLWLKQSLLSARHGHSNVSFVVVPSNLSRLFSANSVRRIKVSPKRRPKATINPFDVITDSSLDIFCLFVSLSVSLVVTTIPWNRWLTTIRYSRRARWTPRAKRISLRRHWMTRLSSTTPFPIGFSREDKIFVWHLLWRVTNKKWMSWPRTAARAVVPEETNGYDDLETRTKIIMRFIDDLTNIFFPRLTLFD